MDYKALTDNTKLEILRKGVEQSLVAVAIADLEGIVLYMNKLAYDLWEATETDIGRHVTEFFKDPQEPLNALTALHQDSRYIGELTAKRFDGPVFQIILSGILIEHEGQKFLFGSMVDVTENRIIQKQLAEYEMQNIFRRYKRLSKREKDIFDLLVAGLPEKRIAELTNIKTKNMSVYLRRIEDKFNLNPHELQIFIKRNQARFGK